MQPLPNSHHLAEGNKTALVPESGVRAGKRPAIGLETQWDSFPEHLDREDGVGGLLGQPEWFVSEIGVHGSDRTRSGEAGIADDAQDARTDPSPAKDAARSLMEPAGDSKGLAQRTKASDPGEKPGSKSSSSAQVASEDLTHAASNRHPSGMSRGSETSDARPGSAGAAPTNLESTDVAELIARSKPGTAAVDEDVDAVQRAGGQSRASTSRSQLRSLDTLLEQHGGSAGRHAKNSPQPAAARAEQVQQMIALEHAAQQATPGARLLQGGIQAIALETGADEGRQNVLSELVTREGAQLKADARTRMITARAMGALASQRGGTLTMRLDPPSLGELTMRMTVMDGVVRAEVTTTNSVARALLEQGLDMLRATLESRGLHVERLSIHGPTSGSDAHSLRSDAQAHDSEGYQEDGAEDARKDAAGEESRGRGRRRQEHDSAGSSDHMSTFKEVIEHD